MNFEFTRIYHSKGELKTDTIKCKVVGIQVPLPTSNVQDNPEPNSRANQPPNEEISIKIEGCDSLETACKIKTCLTYYGEILSDITLLNSAG